MVFSLLSAAHAGRVHSGDEAARRFSTSHQHNFWRTSHTPARQRRLAMVGDGYPWRPGLKQAVLACGPSLAADTTYAST